MQLFKLHFFEVVACPFAKDYIGNLMLVILRTFGGSEDIKLAQLYEHISQYYAEVGATSKLDNLTMNMIRAKAGKSPKLKAKAGEIRDLVPWCLKACKDLLNHEDVEHHTCTAASSYLVEVCSCLSVDQFDKDKFHAAGTNFLKLYLALEEAVGTDSFRWKWKPKFHMMAHLCTSSLSSPAKYWTYRDESFGGSMSHTATHRGGANWPSAISRNSLNKFVAQNQVPQL